ncbi:MAG: glycosyltransferase family 39 protein [Rhodospirillales bacterium]
MNAMLDRNTAIWTGLWLVLMATALLTRPLLPVDETRYLAVAWEMWRDGDFLVPHLNGETYSHKPPLLFWLFHAGWAVFGVNDWWPRLVAPLFGLGSLFLSVVLAKRLWPDNDRLAALTPFILLGCVFWTLFTTLTMFDMLVTFFTLVGLIGIVIAWRARIDGASLLPGFAVLTLGIGFGLLAKGPAILLHTLPVAFMAPLWGPHLAALPDPPKPGRAFAWNAGILAATLIGAAIVLAWALPAAKAGGEEYANAIFWGQSAGRMVDSFAHNRPWWWYLAVLPPLTLPWVIWPRLWRALKTVGRSGFSDGGVRFCLCWFLPAFVAFSLISGKQLHYLLPDFPALAMIFAFALTTSPETTTHAETDGLKRSLRLPAGFFVVLGLAAFAALFVLSPKLQIRYDGLATPWAAAIVAAGLLVIALPAADLRRSIVSLTGLSAVLVVTAHLIAMPMLERNYAISGIAKKLGEWERQGIHLANMNKYHGEYNFLGRLKNPSTVIGDHEPDMDIWMHAFPNGKAVSYHYTLPTGAKPVYVQPFKGKFIAVWESETMRAHPDIVRRN